MSLIGEEIDLEPYERTRIPVDKLIQLPQTRGEFDRDVEELAQSILNKGGLFSPIAVMKMTEEQFQAHVELTNEIWRSSVDPETYKYYLVDGYHYVVVAGHRRTDAIIQASLEKQQILLAPVHIYDYDPDVFLAIQIDENSLRRDVAHERHALAIVETYRYGLVIGKWNTSTEFARASEGRLTPRLIQDTLAFINLPYFARQLVYGGSLKYSVGVALGRTVPVVKKYYTHLSEGKITPEQLDKDTDAQIEYHAGHIIKTQGLSSVKKAQEYLRGEVKRMEEEMEGSQYVMSLVTPEQRLIEHRRYIKAATRAAWREYSNIPPSRAIEVLKLAGRLGTSSNYESEIRALEETRRTMQRIQLREMAGGG